LIRLGFEIMEKISPRVRGILTKWNETRGFGFIRREEGRDVFLHISNLDQNLVRLPQAGDTIIFSIGMDKQGRDRALNATISGVQVRASSPQKTASNTKTQTVQQRRKKQLSPQRLKLNFMLMVGIIGTIFTLPILGQFLWLETPMSDSEMGANLESDTTGVGCDIKGNISQSSDRKLYHVPGMEDYENTNIILEDGERWFCSEAAAQAAGWVRAPR
jgi:cold shock CspA family protein